MLLLAGVVLAPGPAHAGAGLALQMVCADSGVAAAANMSLMPTLSHMLGLPPAGGRPAPLANCVAEYDAVRRQAGDRLATTWTPLTFDGEDDDGRDLGLYTRYAGVLLAGVPAAIADSGNEVTAAVGARFAAWKQIAVDGLSRRVAAFRDAFQDQPVASLDPLGLMLHADAGDQSP
ncbi:MAG: hypothetical protein PW843_15950 [Azospirillaceae bacterium]|nr:hypothetical protein [Azospirillaceae bacterium]